MNDEENIADPDYEVKRNVSIYCSWLPFCGLIISIITTFIMFIKQKEWSLSLVFYTLISLIGMSLIFLLVFVLLRKVLYLEFPYLKGKMKYLTVLAVLILIILQVIIFIFNPVFKLTTIQLNEVETIIKNEASSNYYIVYGAENCVYCIRMEDTYKAAFKKEREKNVFYCDLTNENYSDERLKELNVQKIPVLISYEKGVEVERLEGMQSVEELKKFLNK
ncbi:hypothetical protein acsn021_02930 [Anaerocolumna cellulosilytica]|uniref:Thioredoxin domain-containing protein n=1 Tax=Anaerocolumna cellulosilytica TaxID=433286 RepID=A0A6S6QQ61_9FIRM|nr:thioredoxin family protein [Anaerocolumna cellulosilytica]MBB5196875.1 thiol-disulfide isomerase/thioredoxin [Anaerocolumna cellulosilytica]BCJ92724.1 hypothetical protein acsn021_02930 [Anaerocolumna cellulosilytica]